MPKQTFRERECMHRDEGADGEELRARREDEERREAEAADVDEQSEE